MDDLRAATEGDSNTAELLKDSKNVEAKLVPLWLLVLFIVLLVALLLALIIFFICYLCCRDFQCCKRSHTRRTSDWQSHNEDSNYTSNRSIRHGRFVDNDDAFWVTQRENPNSTIAPVQRTTGGARIIRVQPGQRVLVLPEDGNEIHHVTDNNTSFKDNKQYGPGNTKTNNKARKNNNNNNNVSDNVMMSEDTEFVILSSQPARANSKSSNGSGNQFKSKATAVKSLPMWMPHSNPIRTDASHLKTTTQ